VPGRYQYSLPERPSRDGWFRAGGFDFTTTVFVLSLTIISMVLYAIGGATGPFSKLYFLGGEVRNGQVWRVATWPVAEFPTERWAILALVFFYYAGTRVEDAVGRVRFTILFLAMSIIPAAIASAFEFTAARGLAAGLNPIAIGLLVIFAFDNPNARSWFGVPAWVVGVVFVALNLLRDMGDRLYGTLIVDLGATLVGIVVARQYGMLENFTFIPRVLGARTKTTRRSKRQGGPTVVPGPWAGSPQTTHTAVDQMELDGLLDKISASGIDSLSRGEKARLNELSKKLRGR